MHPCRCAETLSRAAYPNRYSLLATQRTGRWCSGRKLVGAMCGIASLAFEHPGPAVPGKAFALTIAPLEQGLPRHPWLTPFQFGRIPSPPASIDRK